MFDRAQARLWESAGDGHILVRAFRHLVEERLGLQCPEEQEEAFLSALKGARAAFGLPNLPALFARLESEGSAGEGWRRLSVTAR